MTGVDRAGGNPVDIHVVMPIYNDWEAASLLIPALDRVLAESRLSARLVLVNDGSTVDPPECISAPSRAIRLVEVLTLKRNLGHQRALAIALAWAAEHTTGGPVVVMDGDGEDDPADVPRLLQRCRENGDQRIVFAERTRRSETIMFRVCYNTYRLVHYLITGIPVRVGNFSIIPRRILVRLVVVSELWNHFSAAIFKARFPRDTVRTTRLPRLAGDNRMSFTALVVHGLSALSVHSDLVGVRLLATCAVGAGLTSAFLIAVVIIRIATSMAVPGWASTTGGFLVILLAQLVALALSFVFLILGNRSGSLFIPARDYGLFVESCHALRIERTPAPLGADRHELSAHAGTKLA
jgi:hypothetical protein